MKLTRAAATLCIGLASFGCEGAKARSDSSGAVSAAPSSAAVEPAKVIEPPRPAPADLGLEPLIKSPTCDKNSQADSCRVVAEFAEGKRFIAQTPAGEGRWIGNAFVREKGIEKKQLLILWAKQVPTSQVGAGDLPVRVGMGTLDDELVEHGFKMVNALSRSDQPSKRNQARPAVDTFVPTTQRGAVNTAGVSVRLIAEEPIYLRQSGRKVVMVIPNQSSGAAPGDGTYAEFWRATW
ncbi:MAG: hypothetical protein ACM3ZE_17170 [Myxococcales bacterium]